jgi:hypothetical protein
MQRLVRSDQTREPRRSCVGARPIPSPRRYRRRVLLGPNARPGSARKTRAHRAPLSSPLGQKAVSLAIACAGHLGIILLRPLCFEISRGGGGHDTVLITFVGSVHNPKIMLGMLVKVLCGDTIAARRRLPREGNVTFEDLMRSASDFDIRTVTFEGLTSVRDLLLATIGFVTVIAAIRSPGLS